MKRSQDTYYGNDGNFKLHKASCWGEKSVFIIWIRNVSILNAWIRNVSARNAWIRNVRPGLILTPQSPEHVSLFFAHSFLISLLPTHDLLSRPSIYHSLFDEKCCGSLLSGRLCPVRIDGCILLTFSPILSAHRGEAASLPPPDLKLTALSFKPRLLLSPALSPQHKRPTVNKLPQQR